MPGEEPRRDGGGARDEPPLWVPRERGVGWSLNFAHPRAWRTLVLILLALLLPIAVWVAVTLTVG